MTQLTCVYSMHTGQTERMCDMTCVSTCRATRMSEMLTSETAASRIQKVVRVHGTAKPHCHCHYLGAWNSSCHLIPSFLFLALSCRAFSRIWRCGIFAGFCQWLVLANRRSPRCYEAAAM